MIVPLNSAAQPNPPASPFRALFDSFIRDFRVQNPSRKTIEVSTESALQLEAFLLEAGRSTRPGSAGATWPTSSTTSRTWGVRRPPHPHAAVAESTSRHGGRLRDTLAFVGESLTSGARSGPGLFASGMTRGYLVV